MFAVNLDVDLSSAVGPPTYGPQCTVGVLAGTHWGALRCPGRMASEAKRCDVCYQSCVLPIPKRKMKKEKEEEKRKKNKRKTNCKHMKKGEQKKRKREERKGRRK